MRVELDIFSGRPNPVWMLDAQAVATLAAITATLAPAAGQDADALPDLGYRGVAYAWQGRSARAYRGQAGPVAAPLADPDQAVERFLLSHMPEGWESLRSVIADTWRMGGQAGGAA